MESMVKLKEIKPRNLVAKHAHNMPGAGRHEAKRGKKIKRAKQKQEFLKQLQTMDF